MDFFVLRYVNRPIGESGESCNSKYDFKDACQICGTGARLIGQLRTKTLSNVKKHFFGTLDGDYLISTMLYDKLVHAGIKLGDLKKVVDSRNNDLPLFHLYSDYYFPKAISHDGLIKEKQCPVCKRNGYFDKAIIGDIKKNIPTQLFSSALFYSKIEDEFLSQSDVFFSWECMGLSNLTEHGNLIIRYARPLLIVSENFKKSFFENDIKNIEFEAITIK